MQAGGFAALGAESETNVSRTAFSCSREACRKARTGVAVRFWA